MSSIYYGDACTGLRTFPDGIARTCVTSPPYFGLRDYGVEGQIGLEDTPEAYVSRLVEVFREVWRVLADDGTLWLNLGDSYARIGSGGGAGNTALVGNTRLGTQKRNETPPPGLKSKDLMGIPWRVAFALQSDGWYLRQDIIWHKPNPMPESVTDRCTKAHEYLFLLSKSERYYFDSEAMQEPAQKGFAGSEFHTGKTGEHQMGRSSSLVRSGNKERKDRPCAPAGNGAHQKGSVPWEGETRNRRDVWTIPTAPYSGAHFATFPPDLIRPCILAGAPPGGIVLDPFMGSGTTAATAIDEGRDFIGCELNPSNEPLIQQRLRATNLRLL